MDLGLQGKRALVTGASSGIGAAIAVLLAKEGVSVAVNGRDDARTRRTADDIVASGGHAVAVVGDLKDDEGRAAVARMTDEALGGVDILVNNAGGNTRSDNPTWDQLTSSDYIATMNANFVSAAYLARHFAPGMIERKWGRIINMSSAGARKLIGALHDYGAAKAAMEIWSFNLSANLSPHGVTVNCIEPGMILTEGGQRYLETLRDQLGWPDDQAEMERLAATEINPQTVPRLGRSEEIAAAVAFLASEHSGFTTGACWRIDGGVSRAV